MNKPYVPRGKRTNPPVFFRFSPELAERLDAAAKAWSPRVSNSALAEMLIDKGLKAIELKPPYPACTQPEICTPRGYCVRDPCCME